MNHLYIFHAAIGTLSRKMNQWKPTNSSNNVIVAWAIISGSTHWNQIYKKVVHMNFDASTGTKYTKRQFATYNNGEIIKKKSLGKK